MVGREGGAYPKNVFVSGKCHPKGKDKRRGEENGNHPTCESGGAKQKVEFTEYDGGDETGNNISHWMSIRCRAMEQEQNTKRGKHHLKGWSCKSILKK